MYKINMVFRSLPQSIKFLGLSNNEFYQYSATHILDALKAAPGVTHLDLSNNRLHKLGKTGLAHVILGLTSIHELDLSYNGFDRLPVSELAYVLAAIRPSVKTLILKSNGFENTSPADLIIILNSIPSSVTNIVLPKKLAEMVVRLNARVHDEVKQEVDPQLEQGLIVQLKNYVKFAMNEALRLQDNSFFSMLRHGKSSRVQIEAAYIKFASVSTLKEAVDIITKLLARHQWDSSGLSNDSFDTIFLQLLFAETGLLTSQKGLLKLTVPELKVFVPENLEGLHIQSFSTKGTPMFLSGSNRLSANNRNIFRIKAKIELKKLASLVEELTVQSHNNLRYR